MVKYLQTDNTVRAKFHGIRDQNYYKNSMIFIADNIRIITVYETFDDYKCGEREMQIDRM